MVPKLLWVLVEALFQKILKDKQFLGCYHEIWVGIGYRFTVPFAVVINIIYSKFPAFYLLSIQYNCTF